MTPVSSSIPKRTSIKVSTPSTITTAQHIPSELIQNIFWFVGQPIDLLQCALTCKSWCYHALDLLWYKPYFVHPTSWDDFCQVLSGSPSSWAFPYTSFIRRINLSSLSTLVTNSQLLQLKLCDRLERVTLIGCSSLTDDGLVGLLDLKVGKHLTSMDLSDITNISDATIIKIADTCPQLQGLNLSMCKDDRDRCTGVTDEGIITLATKCRHLRRIKLSNCESLTDASALALSRHCPRLLEIDCPVTDEVLMSIFTNLRELRDFRLQQCRSITDAAFTPLSGIDFKKHESPTTLYRTLEHPGNFDQLRMLDLTNASYITDEAIRLIIHASPKIRNLVLNKCKEISDQGVSHICQLGRHLHYLHLGHCENLTDRSITQLTRTCTRLRYLDLAQCSLLTNTAVQALATLPRLKRIGLVKCLNITDEAIDALTKQPRMAASLERVHLSYCIKLSEQSIRRLLNFCPRLNHLSLTHVPAFLRPDFQRFRRIPPKNFTPQQQNVFCVFSGKGVKDLKVYLNEIMTTDFLSQSNPATNDDPASAAPLFPHTPRDAGLNLALLELNPQARFQHIQFLYQQHQQRQQQRDQQHEQHDREEQGDRAHSAQDDSRTAAIPAAAPIPPLALDTDGAPAGGVNELFFIDDERLME